MTVNGHSGHHGSAKEECPIFPSRYFSRLFLFGFVLGTIPAVIIGVVSYFIASNDIQNKVKESNLQLLQQTRMRVEQVLRTVEISSVQYAHSSLVRYALNRNLDSSDFRLIDDLSRGLYNLQAFAGIRNVYLVSPEQNWIISNDGFSDYERFPGKDRFDAYGQQSSNLFWTTRQTGTEMEADKDGTADEATIDLVLKLPMMTESSPPRGLLVVEVRQDEFRKMLAAHSQHGGLYMLDAEGNGFLQNGNPALSAPVGERIRDRLKAGSKLKPFFTETIGGQSYAISYLVSPYNEWVYVSALPTIEMTKETRKIAALTLLACIAWLALTSAGAFYGSSRMYVPVRRLFEFTKSFQKEEDPETRPSESNPKDVFEVIEDRLRVVFSESSRLQEQVLGQLPQLQELLVMRLIMGQLSPSEFHYKAGLYHFPQSWNWLCVLAVQIDSWPDARYRDSDQELLLFAVNNIVSETIPQQHRFCPIVLDESQVTLALTEAETPEAAKLAFNRMAATIQSKVEQYLQVIPSIGISRPFREIGDAANAYKESLKALKGRIHLGRGIILHVDDRRLGCETESAALYARLKLIEEHLIPAVKSGNAQKAEECLDQYLSLLSEQKTEYAVFQMLMIQLISKLLQIPQEYGLPMHRLLGSEGTLEHFLKLRTLDDIREWTINHVLHPVIETVNRQMETQYKTIANQLLQLIHEQFHLELSLEKCASELNYHPVYLSRVFKKETGVSFSEYVTDYRMRKAKEWLETTNMKISEIAEQLSYANATAFIRTFRKMYGMTPGQYRSRR